MMVTTALTTMTLLQGEEQVGAHLGEGPVGVDGAAGIPVDIEGASFSWSMFPPGKSTFA
jgi:hypothetical protein